MERDHQKSIKRLQICASRGVWCEGLGACHANPMPLSLSKTEKVTGESASGEENEGALGSVTRLTLLRVTHGDKSESHSCRAGEKDVLCEARNSRADVRAMQALVTRGEHTTVQGTPTTDRGCCSCNALVSGMERWVPVGWGPTGN